MVLESKLAFTDKKYNYYESNTTIIRNSGVNILARKTKISMVLLKIGVPALKFAMHQ